jgi:gamma-glutamyltranspeptidase/glutathione hydrolase
VSFTTRPEVRGTFGAASSTHWLATQTAMTVLDRGGNAFDAAVAAGFVLQVVEPHLNGLGGEVPIVLWEARRGKVEVICGQGRAPAAASIESLRAIGVSDIPGSGLLAACVPGAFAGWMTLLRDHGTWPVSDVLEFAIGYAESGYPLLPRIAEVIASVESRLREEWPSSAAVYLKNGVPKAWRLFCNPDLAATYRRIAGEKSVEAALMAFYSGFVAEAVDRYCPAHDGLLTGADMATAGLEARHESPVTVDFGGWTVAKCGPWTQGPVFMQQLRLLEGRDVGSLGFLSADHVHLVVECAKLAFADREAWYADPDFADVPVQALLSREYAAERRKLVGEHASSELRPGRPEGREPRLPRLQGGGASAYPGDTVHVAVADRQGNFVACTPSGGWLQSSPVIPGLGFCLGTRAQMFNLDASHPNRVEGGKRPRTTLSPTIALREGAPAIAFGTPGGDQQDQWTLEFFLAQVAFGLDPQAANDAPMFHTTHFPSSFAPHDAHPGQMHTEPMPPGVVAALRARGHDVVETAPWSLGRICGVGRGPDQTLWGSASARGGQAYAAAR